jgi:hypothetical protein
VTSQPVVSSLRGTVNVGFVGIGYGGRDQEGVYGYACNPALGIANGFSIADTTTVIPNPSVPGNFTEFAPSPSALTMTPAISASLFAFWGANDDGYEAICGTLSISSNPMPPLMTIADTTMPIPQGTGNIATFVNPNLAGAGPAGSSKNFALSGNTLAFYAAGSPPTAYGGQQGIYGVTVAVSSQPIPFRVAPWHCPTARALTSISLVLTSAPSLPRVKLTLCSSPSGRPARRPFVTVLLASLANSTPCRG